MVISIYITDPRIHRVTYACGHSSVSNRDVVDTDLMYSVGDVRQIGSEDECSVYSPRPFGVVRLCSGYALALHTLCVDLCRIAICSSGIDLDGVRDLVAIHWLREMDLELDSICRGQAIVVPREKPGNHWSWRYIFILGDEHFIAPSPKIELGKATGESLLGVIV